MCPGAPRGHAWFQNEDRSRETDEETRDTSALGPSVAMEEDSEDALILELIDVLAD